MKSWTTLFVLATLLADPLAHGAGVKGTKKAPPPPSLGKAAAKPAPAKPAPAKPAPAEDAPAEDAQAGARQEAPKPSQESPAAARAMETAPEEAAAQWAGEKLGAEALDILGRTGYAILHEGDGGPRLMAVHEEGLKELAGQSLAVAEFAEAYRRFAAGNRAAQPGEALTFAPLRRLRHDGLMTPALHAALRVMAAAHDDLTALDSSRAAWSETGPTLFETPWGKAFAARNRAQALSDPAGIVDPFFEEFLAGANPNVEAAEHLRKYLATAYKKDVSPLVDADTRDASLSTELRGWIARYVSDQRRIHAVTIGHRESLASLAAKAKPDFDRQLADLETVAKALSGAAGFAEGVRERLGRPAPEPLIKLTSGGIHLRELGRRARLERGDTAVVTGVYWVDGIPEAAEGRAPVEMEFEETTFAEGEKGAWILVATRKVRRANGGPYDFMAEFPLPEPGRYVLRSIVSAPHANTLAEKAPAEVSDAYDRKLAAMAAADGMTLDCRFQDAETAYADLETGISVEDARKGQYAQLLSASRLRRAEAARYAKLLDGLEKAIADSRDENSPDRCNYQTPRTEAAIKLVAALPAGCDKYLSDLRSQLATIQRRRAEQAAFSRAVDKARQMEKDCQFSSAADSMTQALAVFDADPAARCGTLDRTARKIEEDLASVRTMAAWGESLDKSVMEAENPQAKGAGDPAAVSLRIVNQALARLPTLAQASCFSDQRAALERLSEDEGRALAPPPDAAVARLLPDDTDLVKTSARIAEERRRLQQEDASDQRKRLEQESPPAQPADRQAERASAAPPAKESAADAAKSPSRKPVVKRHAKPQAPKKKAGEAKPAQTDSTR